MAVLRGLQGSLLEENIARTAGSIGESVAAGAIFTLPAFLMAHAWPSFGFRDAYWQSTVLMIVGSVLGVLFVSLVRRVMVEDPELPFPESVAASEIHKAASAGRKRRQISVLEHRAWRDHIPAGPLRDCSPLTRDIFFPIGELGSSRVRLGGAGYKPILATGGVTSFAAPSVSPAYLGVG